MRRSAFLKEFGERLREARLRAGWSQEELAGRCGMHQVTISQLEGGRSNASLLTVEKLAKTLGIAARDLLPTK